MYEYTNLQAAGFTACCDAMVAKVVDNQLFAFFLSVIGTPSSVKALTAILYGGDTCRVSNPDDTGREFEFLGPEQIRELTFPGNLQTCRSRKIGDTVNKLLVSASITGANQSDNARSSALVYGPDMPTVIERAFLRFDAATTIPLKPEWQGWLWDEVLQPEKLYSFGGEELREAYLVSWPGDDTLQERILEGISMHYLN